MSNNCVTFMFNILTNTCCVFNIVPDCLRVCLCYIQKNVKRAN
jgi:hypothetical protein